MRQIGDLVLNRPLFFAHSDWTVIQTAKYMSEKKIGAVPILQSNQLIGIFSERDLMSRVVVAGKNPETMPVTQVMTKDLVTAHPEDDPQTCLRKMHQARCRHLPVIEDGKLIGVISLRELMQLDLAEKVVEIRAMADYIHSMPAS